SLTLVGPDPACPGRQRKTRKGRQCQQGRQSKPRESVVHESTSRTGSRWSPHLRTPRYMARSARSLEPTTSDEPRWPLLQLAWPERWLARHPVDPRSTRGGDRAVRVVRLVLYLGHQRGSGRGEKDLRGAGLHHGRVHEFRRPAPDRGLAG